MEEFYADSKPPVKITTVKPSNNYDYGPSFANFGISPIYASTFMTRKKMPPAAVKAPEVKEPRKIDVEFHGDKFIIPDKMEFDEAILALTKKRDEENVDVNISEIVNAFPLDGAVAFQKVLAERHGWVNLVPTKDFFGRDVPPNMKGVEIALNETIQIPWGNCKVPNIDGVLSTGFDIVNGMPVFCLRGTVKRRHERIVADIAKRIREIVAEDSIYRGQAVKINFRNRDGDRPTNFDPDFCPRFIDMAKYKDLNIVYATETEQLIKTNLFNPVQFTERCRKNGIPLKRGILLEGRYGTGKTLTAYKLAQLCMEHGWTFLYLEDVRDLGDAVAFAKMYAPCVLFAEDVDRTIPQGNRTPEIDKILNTLDGVESKHVDVMTVFTTNFVGGIHSGFLRPGRIDTVIPILPPDENAILRLIRHYGRTKDGVNIIEGTDQELMAVIKGLKGSNAAFVQEAVERSKLSALSVCEGDLVIKPDDIRIAVESMKTHIQMVCPNSGEMDPEDHAVDPTKFAMELLLDQLSFAILNKVTDPKVISKVILKTAKNHGSRRDPFSQN